MALSKRVRRYAPATLRHLRQPPPLSQCRSVASADFDTGALAAVLLRAMCWGDVWLIADDDVVADHPDIETSGLPVVRCAALPNLERLDAESLRALDIVKRSFPTARVLQ